MISNKVVCCLKCCSFFDIVFSAIFIVATIVYVTNCHVEDETVINHDDTTLGQIEYFYRVLEECGYSEESHIPPKDMICSELEKKVMPFAGFSLTLDFCLGVFIQIMLRDKYFFLDKEFQKPVRFVSFVGVPIASLISMLFYSIALNEYIKLCWLTHYISEQRKCYAYSISIIVVPLILAVHKPVELCIFCAFGYALFTKEDTEKQVEYLDQPTSQPKT